MKNYYDYDSYLKYDKNLLYNLKVNISILGIIDSYFKSLTQKEIKIKVYPNYKFFYNFCPFHHNHQEHCFYVDEKVNLFYCYGCGRAGNVFDFLYQAYGLDLNESTEILGCIYQIFPTSILNSKQLEIYKTLILNYNKQDDLLEQSKQKTIYLIERINRYLITHNLDQSNLTKLDFYKIAKRLCCNWELVEKLYSQTEYQQNKKREQHKLMLQKEKEMIFD